MATRLPWLNAQFFDANGKYLVGGLLYTYEAGTTTPQVTYTDATEAVANTNPIVLDSRGAADVFLGDGLVYDLVLTTPGGSLERSWTNVVGGEGGGGVSGDFRVKISSSDAVAGFLSSKLAAGDNVSLAINTSPSGDTLELSAEDEKVSLDGVEAPGYLADLIAAGSNISIAQVGGQLVITGTVPPSTDELAKVSAADTTAGYLASKIVAGSDISVDVLNVGGDEQLRVSFTGAPPDDRLVAVSPTDTTPAELNSKITVDSTLTKSLVTPGGNETLNLTANISDESGNMLEGRATGLYVPDKLSRVYQITDWDSLVAFCAAPELLATGIWVGDIPVISVPDGATLTVNGARKGILGSDPSFTMLLAGSLEVTGSGFLLVYCSNLALSGAGPSPVLNVSGNLYARKLSVGPGVAVNVTGLFAAQAPVPGQTLPVGVTQDWWDDSEQAGIPGLWETRTVDSEPDVLTTIDPHLTTLIGNDDQYISATDTTGKLVVIPNPAGSGDLEVTDTQAAEADGTYVLGAESPAGYATYYNSVTGTYISIDSTSTYWCMGPSLNPVYYNAWYTNYVTGGVTGAYNGNGARAFFTASVVAAVSVSSGIAVRGYGLSRFDAVDAETVYSVVTRYANLTNAQEAALPDGAAGRLWYNGEAGTWSISHSKVRDLLEDDHTQYLLMGTARGTQTASSAVNWSGVHSFSAQVNITRGTIGNQWLTTGYRSFLIANPTTYSSFAPGEISVQNADYEVTVQSSLVSYSRGGGSLGFRYDQYNLIDTESATETRANPSFFMQPSAIRFGQGVGSTQYIQIETETNVTKGTVAGTMLMIGPSDTTEMDYSQISHDGGLYSVLTTGVLNLSGGSYTRIDGDATTVLVQDTGVRVNYLAGASTRLVAADADGDLTAIATGTDGYVMTLVAGVPTWAAASGGSGATDGTTLIGDGSAGNEYRINLANANTWTALQTDKVPSSVTNSRAVVGHWIHDTNSASVATGFGAELKFEGTRGASDTPVYLGAIGIDIIGSTSTGFRFFGYGNYGTNTRTTLATLTTTGFTCAALSSTGVTILGDAPEDSLTVAGQNVYWTNNPTHSGNHTFSGNLTVGGSTINHSASATVFGAATLDNADFWLRAGNTVYHGAGVRLYGHGTGTKKGFLTYGAGSSASTNVLSWDNNGVTVNVIADATPTKAVGTDATGKLVTFSVPSGGGSQKGSMVGVPITDIDNYTAIAQYANAVWVRAQGSGGTINTLGCYLQAGGTGNISLALYDSAGTTKLAEGIITNPVAGFNEVTVTAVTVGSGPCWLAINNRTVSSISVWRKSVYNSSGEVAREGYVGDAAFPASVPASGYAIGMCLWARGA